MRMLSNADAIVNLARKNGQIIRGHTCTWYKQLPNWVKDGNFECSDVDEYPAISLQHGCRQV
ncbi:hypothetical protein MPER_00831 [Moniliophthora perniciosa FA553]|nr:hypothetical protein MPER_00831 [Moniliophthora perniciosa FA553]